MQYKSLSCSIFNEDVCIYFEILRHQRTSFYGLLYEKPSFHATRPLKFLLVANVNYKVKNLCVGNILRDYFQNICVYTIVPKTGSLITLKKFRVIIYRTMSNKVHDRTQY